MKWLIDNWSLLVVILAVIGVGFYQLRKLSQLPSQAQQQKIKEWLLYAVLLAEKELGSGVGAMKLRYVYSLFIDKFPSIAPVVPFELFSTWVDEVLVQMKQLLESNEKLSDLINGGAEE